MSLKDKVAIITGAGRGIGKAIAERLGKDGVKICIAASSDEIFKTKEELSEKGYIVEAFKVDIKNSQSVDDMFNKVIESFGRIDILINNAGITRDTLIMRMSEQDWDDVLDVNLKGSFLCTKVASKYMMKQKSGKIINITSVVGVMGNAGQTNYSSSKAGMIGLTKSVAKELASRGITCNAIAPGFIDTKMTDNISENVKENYINAIPLKRFGTPEEVAATVAFLSSSDANYITGQVIHIDGGLVM
jgi:3-oxoacyl-[acyl-carrier protein] reductase